MSDSTSVVHLMLTRAGLSVSPAELEAFVRTYDAMQAGIDAMYAVEATRYESPALVFTPTPAFVDWD